jgi:hypothetical protein
MPQLVQAWLPAICRRALDARVCAQANKGGLQLCQRDRLVGRGPKECRTHAGGRWSPALVRVPLERLAELRADRHQAGLEEFRIPDRQHMPRQIHVAALQAQSLARAQPRRVEHQQEHAPGVGGHVSAWRCQRGGGIQESTKFIGRVDVGLKSGRHPWTGSRQGDDGNLSSATHILEEGVQRVMLADPKLGRRGSAPAKRLTHLRGDVGDGQIADTTGE